MASPPCWTRPLTPPRAWSSRCAARRLHLACGPDRAALPADGGPDRPSPRPRPAAVRCQAGEGADLRRCLHEVPHCQRVAQRRRPQGQHPLHRHVRARQVSASGAGCAARCCWWAPPFRWLLECARSVLFPRRVVDRLAPFAAATAGAVRPTRWVGGEVPDLCVGPPSQSCRSAAQRAHTTAADWQQVGQPGLEGSARAVWMPWWPQSFPASQLTITSRGIRERLAAAPGCS